MSSKNGSLCKPKTVSVKAYDRSKPCKKLKQGPDPHIFLLLTKLEVENMFVSAR